MLPMLNPGPGWLEDAEEESDCEKAPAVIPSIMASSRRNLRMRNLSFGKACTTTAEILSPPFQMSKQPTRRIFAFIIRVRNFILRFIRFIRISSKRPVPKGMLHGLELAQFTSSATRACLARVADLRLPLVVHVAVLARYRGLRDPHSPGYAERRAFLRLPSSSSLAYCRRHGRASGGPLAVSQKLRARALNLRRWLGRFH